MKAHCKTLRAEIGQILIIKSEKENYQLTFTCTVRRITTKKSKPKKVIQEITKEQAQIRGPSNQFYGGILF